jgi:hypothetical protein
MRWTQETREERAKRLSQWHKWFAWRPVRVWKLNPRKSHRTHKEMQMLEHSNQVIWLERIMRKFEDDTRIYASSQEEVTMIQLADPLIRHRIIIREDD